MPNDLHYVLLSIVTSVIEFLIMNVRSIDVMYSHLPSHRAAQVTVVTLVTQVPDTGLGFL